jgi:septal ring factor EnvC (AmiA/AmiB activator)
MNAGVLLIALVGAAQLGGTLEAPLPPNATAAEREQRLSALKTELDARRAALSDLDNKRRSLLDSIGTLDESLARLDDEIDAAERQLNQLRTELAALKASSGLDDETLAAAKARLSARMRALVVAGEGATARALLGAEGFEELALRRRLLRRLAETDAKLVGDVARAERTVSERRARLKAAEREAQHLQQQLSEQRAFAVGTRTERQAALLRIAQERTLQERAARELEHQREVLASLIKRLTDEGRRLSPVPARGRGILTGRLPWPTEGVVIRRFGVIIDPDTRAEVVSNGLELRAEAGTPVQAIADARVAHVGWLRGFGRVVILDHGEGHHTLSAHLERTTVAAGDLVRARQTIGFVGDTESNNGAKLYFELRENGRPRNPAPFLR